MNLAEEHDDDDDDDENADSSSAESDAESASSSDEEEIVTVRRPKKTARTTRTSSRSTRFQSSMEEPRDSIRDLLVESSSPKKKSPAKSHSSARRKVRSEVHVDSESSSSEEEEESDMDEEEGDEEEEPFKIQRIIASRSEPKKIWKEICNKIHTSEIEYGSRWFQENEHDDDDDTYEERFLVKWSDLSYLHCSWETQNDLVEQIDGAKSYLSTFFKKSENGLLFSADERCDGDYFDPAFVQIDRILEVDPPEGMDPKTRCEDDEIVDTFGICLDRTSPDFESGTGRQFLVKWKNTPYSEGTFEFERDLILNEVDYLDDLKKLEKRSKKVRVDEFMIVTNACALAS